MPLCSGRLNVDRARIGESAHPAKGAEVMVERAILLHQDDDVLHISNRSGAVVCRNLERLGDVRLQRRQAWRAAPSIAGIYADQLAMKVTSRFRECAI